MGIFTRLTGLLTKSGRDNDVLLQALEHAKAKRPEKAIPLYNTLLDSSSTSEIVRARALFNRALAHSAMKDDDKALVDLEQVLAMTNVPENVQTAARSQVARVRRRSGAAS
jgi:hypothetical protein